MICKTFADFPDQIIPYFPGQWEPLVRLNQPQRTIAYNGQAVCKSLSATLRGSSM